MGGTGSGRQAGFGFTASKVNDFQQIDLAWLKRQGALKVGNRGTLRWSRGGSEVSSIGYVVEASGLRLAYRCRSHGAEGIDVNELIPFGYTTANYGGKRRWFSCPSCRSRCRILYGGSRFRCRRCYRLSYESQYESQFSRAASQAHALRARLGQYGSLDEPFPTKPKGMRWNTYRRLEARDEELQARWAIGVMGWLKRNSG